MHAYMYAQVTLYCKREALRRMKVDVAGEAAERKRLGLHKSDGMKNVSKNMGTGDSDSDSDYDADNVSVHLHIQLCIRTQYICLCYSSVK
jgi:hypothetical protein